MFAVDRNIRHINFWSYPHEIEKSKTTSNGLKLFTREINGFVTYAQYTKNDSLVNGPDGWSVRNYRNGVLVSSRKVINGKLV